MTRLAAFCKSGTLLDDVSTFCLQNTDTFAATGATEAGAYSLEMTALHASYCALVEAKLEEFLVGQRVASDDLHAACKACLQRSQQESRWNRDALVARTFIASNEFEEWAELMRSVAEGEAAEDEDVFAPPDDDAQEVAQASPVPLN